MNAFHQSIVSFHILGIVAPPGPGAHCSSHSTPFYPSGRFLSHFVPAPRKSHLQHPCNLTRPRQSERKIKRYSDSQNNLE